MKQNETEKIVALILAGKTSTAIAAELKVSRVTAWRRMNEPDVKAMLTEVVSSSLDDARRLYADAIVYSLRFLYERMSDERIPFSERVRIALSIMRAGTFREAAD